jgi:hypothetical protein
MFSMRSSPLDFRIGIIKLVYASGDRRLAGLG